MHICVAYLYCISVLHIFIYISGSHIFIAYLYCISVLHIVIAHLENEGGLIGHGSFFIAYLLHTVASLPLTASILLSVLHICIAYRISLLQICIAYLCCISVLQICI